MTSHSSIPQSNASVRQNSSHFSASSSLRELLDSLSREQRQNQELLASLVFALRSFTNLHRFLELIPVIASRLVGAQSALLVPFRDDGRVWRELLQVVSFDRSEEFLAKLAKFQAGQIVGFGTDDNQVLAMDTFIQKQIPVKGLCATSLVSRGRIRGRLYVFNLLDIPCWTDFQRRHLQLLGDLTAVAIENDLILQEIRRHEKVDRQISIGAEIQSQLLPAHCPVIDGVELAACCRQALQVGGDYYDFMPTRPDLTGAKREKGRWAFVIGDVMGKGVPAGLLMTMLRGMLRAEVLSGLPPNRILYDLNQLALEDLAHSHRFVTLFYSDYNPKSKKLRFANAAHNPPLLWQASQRAVVRLDVPGLLIGLQPEAEYAGGEIFLEPGDVLLYYTDGVTEASGLAGDRFDETRLIKTLEEAARSGLSAKLILEKLFKRLDSFVGSNHNLEDDASMVVLKVDEKLILPNLQT